MTSSFTAERRRVTSLRLAAQGLAAHDSAAPVDVVRHLLAMQAQDFSGAKWSVGLRMKKATDAAIEVALADRSIVRSWPMRGTLHFVAAEDLGWMLALTAERTIRSAAGRHRQLELTDAEFAKARGVAESVLADGPLPRTALLAAFEDAGLSTAGQRGAHIVLWLAVSQVTVFGPVDGKQQTFALFDDWIGAPTARDRDEALGDFALRYFRSHGPATVRDFAWWSSLTLTDARRGIAVAGDRLEASGEHYQAPDLEPARNGVWALPGFDEYLLGYQDRSAALHLDHGQRVVPGGNGMFMPTIVVNGEVVGTWKRTLAARETTVEARPFGALGATGRRGFAAASARYGEFVGKPTRIV